MKWTPKKIDNDRTSFSGFFEVDSLIWAGVILELIDNTEVLIYKPDVLLANDYKSDLIPLRYENWYKIIFVRTPKSATEAISTVNKILRSCVETPKEQTTD